MLPPRQVHRGTSATVDHQPTLQRLMRVVVASALVGVAFLIAPEQPEQQASICQQHHSAEACRVW